MLVNDIWGGEVLKGGPAEWNTPIWEHDLDKGLRILRLAIETHLVTSHHLLPLLVDRPGGLLVEVTDGTAAYNATEYRISVFYDLAKVAVNRLAFSQGHELAPHGATAVAITPGCLRSEMMLEHFGVTEANWRDALDQGAPPLLRLVRVTPLRRPGGGRPGGRPRPRPVEPAVGHLRPAGGRVRLHRPRRLPARQLAFDRGAVMEGPADVVRRQFDAFELGGLDRVAEFWHPGIEWRAVEGAADDVGVMTGHAALRRYYQDWIDSFDQLRAQVDEVLFENGGRAGVQVRNSGVGRVSGVMTEGRYYVVATVADSQILRGREYATRAEALEAAPS